MTRRYTLGLLVLVAHLATVASGFLVDRAHAQEPAAPTGGDRILLPIIAGPSIFTEPWPANGAERQSLNAFLTWKVDSPEWAGATFSVLLEPDDDSPDQLLAAGLPKANFDPYTFAEDTIYYWRVVAELPNGRRSASPAWHFRTDYFPETPELGSMVYVPAGEFQMGCDPLNSGFECFYEQLPLHVVYLDSFAFDKYEVSNQEYRACVDAGACNLPKKTSSLLGTSYYYAAAYASFPVVYVSHWDADDYCQWAGKRLPTEAEWEKAARGSIDTRPWPWGDENWTCETVNRCTKDPDWFPARVDDFRPGQSPYGALNMSGNVFEWLQDDYSPLYYGSSPYANPVNREQYDWGDGKNHSYYAIRGGSYHDNWFYARVSHRKYGHLSDPEINDFPYYRSLRVGIRCAMTIAP